MQAMEAPVAAGGLDYDGGWMKRMVGLDGGGAGCVRWQALTGCKPDAAIKQGAVVDGRQEAPRVQRSILRRWAR